MDTVKFYSMGHHSITAKAPRVSHFSASWNWIQYSRDVWNSSLAKTVLPFDEDTKHKWKISKIDIQKAPKLFSGLYFEEEISTPVLNHIGFVPLDVKSEQF